MDPLTRVGINVGTEILKQLGSCALKEISLVWGVDEELKKFKNTLARLECVREYVENRKVQDKMARLWLQDLDKIAYDAQDTLQMVVYDTRKHKIEGDDKINQNLIKKALSSVTSSLESFASFVTEKTESLSSSSVVAHRMQNVNTMLDDAAKTKNALHAMQMSTSDHHHEIGLDRDTSPFIDHSKIFGREHEKSIIMKWLLDDSHDHTEQNFSVLPIVGHGGLGKTTLAQLVFNDEVVARHFGMIEWVCVANDSNHRTLLREVFQGICEASSSVIQPNKNQMQKSLKEKIQGKKFLLVLDDVWKTDEWDDITVILKHGDEGSRVLVSTRKEVVAKDVGTVNPFNLDRLPEEYCWEIFEQRAFRKGGPPKTPTFEKIGRDIVAKCGGFPLAVKAIGALMHSKETIADWVSVRDIEDLLVIDETGLMRVIRLSYDHLSSPLKRCFKYCAIFPKDMKIMKDDLIRQWVAQGFIPSSSDDHLEMEEVGNNYFQYLCWNSLFQVVEEDKINGVISCKMHDIVHKLALSVAEKECLVVDSLTDATRNGDIGETRHFRTDLYNNEENVSILEKLTKAKAKLHTFTSSVATWASDRWLMFKEIRVLRLENVGDLPSSIGDMKLLRYLYLGSMQIQVLPESISKLYLLETLDVHLCFVLKELPEDMWKLIGLRHLLLPSHQIKMPKKFGRLLSLRTISPILYLGKEEDGQGISELEHLNHITGHLIICNLDDVRSTTHTKNAKLDMKKKISHLAMKWNQDEDEGSENNDSAEAAEALGVPPNLQELSMQGFPGVKLPITMWSLGYLIHIKLEKCKMLEEFPPACHTPPTTLNMLQSLHVCDCPKLKLALASFTSLEKIFVSKIHSVVVEVAMEECSSSTAPPHPCYLASLISLVIEYVPEFMALPKGFLQRSEHLQLVSIKHCDKFRGFHGEEELLVPRPSNLKTVTLMSCSSVDSLDVRGLTSLEKLEVVFCRNARVTAAQLPSLKYLQLHLVQSFIMEPIANNVNKSFLTGLSFVKVEDFTTFPKGLLQSCSKYLRWLDIEDCPKFQGFNQDELHLLASLERLCIIKCPCLTSLDVERLVSLQELTFVDCKGIKSSPFPEGVLESLTLLHTLEIGGFSEELDYLPFPAIQGNDSPLRSSLKKLTIWGWSNLTFLPKQLQHLTALEKLQIKCCNTPIALPEWLGNLSSLCDLEIYDCRALMDFPSGQQMQRLNSLISVRIKNCPLLSRRLMSDDQERLKFRNYDIDHDEDTSTTTISLEFGVPPLNRS